MWQILAWQALDLARERTEEARRHAMAAEARRLRRAERRRHRLPATPGPFRSTTARALRAVSGTLVHLADGVAVTATRVDGRTAYRTARGGSTDA